MGKKAKSRRAQERKNAKRALKAARAALYKKYAEMGRKKGSRRSGKSKQRKPRGRTHPRVPCGNIGCPRCYPFINMPYLIYMRELKLDGHLYQETTRYRKMVTANMELASGSC